MVQFLGRSTYFRDRSGKRRERDTGQTGQIKALDCARAIIDKEYALFDSTQEEIDWDDVIARLKARLATGGIRDTTIGYYEKAIRSVRSTYPESNGPVDITARQAAEFRDKMMSVCKWQESAICPLRRRPHQWPVGALAKMAD